MTSKAELEKKIINLIQFFEKKLYDDVPFFKQGMRIKVKATTATVDVVANDIGRYITPMISVIKSSGGTFSRNCSIDFLL